MQIRDTGAAGLSPSGPWCRKAQVSSNRAVTRNVILPCDLHCRQQQDWSDLFHCHFQMIFHYCALHLIWRGSSVSGTGADMAKRQSTRLPTPWISGEVTTFADFLLTLGCHVALNALLHVPFTHTHTPNPNSSAWARTEWTECVAERSSTERCSFRGDESRKVRVKLSGSLEPLSRTFYTREFSLNHSSE